MFTDGLNTLGEEISDTIEAPGIKDKELLSYIAVYIFYSGDFINHSLLKVWARKSGGVAYNLQQENDFNHVSFSCNYLFTHLILPDYIHTRTTCFQLLVC